MADELSVSVAASPWPHRLCQFSVAHSGWRLAGLLANAAIKACAFIAVPNSQVRPAVPAGMTTAARSRARGSRALVPSRCA